MMWFESISGFKRVLQQTSFRIRKCVIHYIPCIVDITTWIATG